MFETNVFSPIYSYQKYVKYLDGRKGVMAITVSAIGEMAMPGFTIYSSSKFAMHGFQQGVRLEKPDNVQLTCLYPVATNTNFFRVANDIQFKKPFPVQEPELVAKKMVEGIESGKSKVSPCLLFDISKILMGIIPPVRTIYWGLEKKKFAEFKNNIKNKTGVKWDE
jgi:short-subunit dehydrogenase